MLERFTGCFLVVQIWWWTCRRTPFGQRIVSSDSNVDISHRVQSIGSDPCVCWLKHLSIPSPFCRNSSSQPGSNPSLGSAPRTSNYPNWPHYAHHTSFLPTLFLCSLTNLLLYYYQSIAVLHWQCVDLSPEMEATVAAKAYSCFENPSSFMIIIYSTFSSPSFVEYIEEGSGMGGYHRLCP